MTLKPLPRVWPHNNCENTTEGLISLCREWIKPHFTIVEVGCFAGVSTAVFAESADHVYAVDPWTLATEYSGIPRDMIVDAEKQFDLVMKEHPNITQIRDFSVSAAVRFIDASLDAVYIDADHNEGPFKSDLTAWMPKLKPSGLLMGHDYGQISSYLKQSFVRHLPVKVYPEESWVIQLLTTTK